MKNLSWVLLLGMLIWSCAGDSGSSNKQSSTATQQDGATASAGEQKYPSLPLDTLTMLFEQCDYIDYVFYYTSFSVNQSGQEDIRSALRHIAEEAAVIKPSCKPIGRMFYQVDGENRLVADLYFSPQADCVYYLFMEDGKPAYANKMMPAGINFIGNLLERTKSMPTQ